MKPKTDDEFRMSATEFDQMMRGALSAPAPKEEKKKPLPRRPNKRELPKRKQA